MYRRFLNNSDYLGNITQDALKQITRGKQECFILAEQSAEMSITEHLSENYEVEQELSKGKYIAPYDRQITYPVAAHILMDNKIYEVTRSISGYRQPADKEYWEETITPPIIPESGAITSYSQFETYHPGNIVLYNDTPYICLADNGYKFSNVRIPMVAGWLKMPFSDWQPTDYLLWEVVSYQETFYTLVTLEGFDNNEDPLKSGCWGAIADYDPAYNAYELSGHEYVTYNNQVFYPETDVNADIPQPEINLSPHDPRNYNLKKHLVRLAIYELTKLIAPNNVSVIRMRDYEDSMKWLNDAAKLRINPGIPRRLGLDKQPITDWQIATFQTNYDPYKNPWHI